MSLSVDFSFNGRGIKLQDYLKHFIQINGNIKKTKTCSWNISMTIQKISNYLCRLLCHPRRQKPIQNYVQLTRIHACRNHCPGWVVHFSKPEKLMFMYMYTFEWKLLIEMLWVTIKCREKVTEFIFEICFSFNLSHGNDKSLFLIMKLKYN